MARDLTGTLLGKYQIIERFGRGGMADVYRAYQPGMDRIVAVKVMHAHLATESSFIERFKREAHSVGNLRHPYIVQVIDFDVQDDDYYMVMEFIEGNTLKTLLQSRGALPVTEALDITVKLADALSYAHGEGMVHRDIKPANILFGKSNMPILTDFGIARIMDASGLTMSGAFVGTPSYVSPEAGRGEPVDERADIYSLGIVLYEMLTGTVPYDADTPYAVILKHINDPLPTPRQFNASLPEAVERIILKALAKNKEERFQTAGEFKAALENARASTLSELPTHAGQSTSPAAGGLPRRAGISTLATGAVAVVILLGMALLLLSGRNNAPSTNIPVAPAFTNTQSGAQTSVTISITALPSSNPSSTAAAVPLPSGKYATLIDQVNRLLMQGSPDQALPLVESAFKYDPQSYDLLILRGRIYAESSDDVVRRKAEPDAQAAIRIEPNRPDAYVVLGQLYMIINGSPTNDERIAQYKKAIAKYTVAINMGTQDYRAYWGRALTNNWLNDYGGSDRIGMDSAVIADFDKAASFSPKDYRFYADRGLFYFNRLNVVDAQKNYEQVLALEPTDYDAHQFLASAYLAQNLKQKAFDLYVSGIEKDSQHGSKYLADGAYVARINGQPDKANEWGKLALALNPDTPAANYTLALLAWDNKNYEEALRQLDVVLKVADVGQYDFPFLNRYFDRLASADRGRILVEMGKFDDALAAYNDALQKEKYWPELFIERAKVYRQQGKDDEARQDLRAGFDYAVTQKDRDAQKTIRALLDQVGPATETQQ